MESSTFKPTERSQVKRLPKRGAYDKDSLFKLLDASIIAHISYVMSGKPYTTPTSIWRKGDTLYWHGSSMSRMLEQVKTGIDVCVSIAHLDGLVLARSGFNHSLNYRSAILFGTCTLVPDEEKEATLYDFMERLCPGRWEHVRPPTAQELKATHVVRMHVEEASVKIREGAPKDDEEDYKLPVWAGVIPIVSRTEKAIEDLSPHATVDPSTLPSGFRHLGF